MLYRLRQSFRLQLAFLIAVTALGALAYALWHAGPILRFSGRMLTLGAVAGIFGAFIVLAGTLLGLAFPRTGLRDTLLENRRVFGRASRATLSGGVIAAAAGEEYLLRGLVFGSVVDSSYAAALLLTAALSGIGYYRGRRNWYWTLLRIVEACWYAVVFDQRRSLTLVVAARLVALTCETAALRSEFAGCALEDTRLSWRKLYVYNKTTRRVLRRV